MKRKWMLAIGVALAVVLTGAVSAAASTLYVGDTDEYSISFKAEGTELYLVEFAGKTSCYYTEPYEAIGPGGFNVFAEPQLMRPEEDGLYAETIGRPLARVRAEVAGDAVSGDYEFDVSEESFHCDTGYTPKPFQAARYEPIGSPGAAPASGERPVYYASEGSIELFTRASAKEAYGVRGTFVPQCRVGRGKTIPARHSLFSEPAAAKVEGGAFEKRAVGGGKTLSGIRYRETSLLSGRVEEGAVTGSYKRVRTVKPPNRPKRRCVTGPIPFRAVRYLPASR